MRVNPKSGSAKSPVSSGGFHWTSLFRHHEKVESARCYIETAPLVSTGSDVNLPSAEVSAREVIPFPFAGTFPTGNRNR
jgi:hypothetical protein